MMLHEFNRMHLRTTEWTTLCWGVAFVLPSFHTAAQPKKATMLKLGCKESLIIRLLVAMQMVRTRLQHLQQHLQQNLQQHLQQHLQQYRLQHLQQHLRQNLQSHLQ